MRHIQAVDVDFLNPETAKLENSGEEGAQRSLISQMQRALPLPSFLRKALNRRRYEYPGVAVVEAMLLALKVATESYLQGPIVAVDLAVPFPLAKSGRKLVQSASRIADFESVLGTQIAGQAAARANGIGACYDYPEEENCDGKNKPQLVLTVDYSRAALTAMLWIEEAGVFEYRRIQHDVDLGADALYRCEHSQSDKPCYERLPEMLRQVVKMPLEDAESDVPGMIGNLVLLGERATEGRFTKVLQQVLREQAASTSVTNPEWKEGGIVDPVFAAARGVAATSWQRQKEPFVKTDLQGGHR